MTTRKITAVVAAAGSSQRMGRENKLLLPYRNTTVLGHVLKVVTAAPVHEVVVVLGHQAERVLTQLEPYRPAPDRVVVAHNPRFEEGLTCSIQAGIEAASPNVNGWMICLADHVLLETAHLVRLIDSFSKAQPGAIVLPIKGGRRGHPVIFDACFRAELAALPPGNGCKAVLKHNPQQVIEVPFDAPGPFTDLDTPSDYQRLIGA